ncbi:uncharacterized protein PHACADRAFT_181111 [Phanerochaete carnosa HHB-10118-sp]|uniref:Uncharacterized protein n=1 Tax=Phanerochaete carnosa (strain HHB-10118-sp) TaxID=650164 RepID=K5X899_PHACS|nr:uncharacterized protein PHACADRAFT_181111 [Phanerochaete carnosa HHB-10118-sp]EKM59107.1 hypothetical protein PHACADRAFT_181111 [Phanerochaete carnosa HHB-10118-sp]
MAQTLMTSGSLFRRYFGTNLELLLLYLFLLGLLSVPFTSLGLVFILKSGHPIQFPPSDPHVGFVAGPDYRGTLNIIWVCISTIFTCVYLSVHVDISDKSRATELTQTLQTAPTQSWAGKIARHLAPLWHFTAHSICLRVLWMLFNIFAPELVVFVAALERMSATDAVKFMRSRGQNDWNMKLAFFADMGGFELDDGTHFRDGLSFLKWFDRLQETHEGGVVLTVRPLVDEINDRSNADLVLKVFTCLQATWLLIQTFVRLAEGKAVSELEITTCAYILCTVISYACWLQKPYSIAGRIVIRDKFIVPRNEYTSRQQSSPLSRSHPYLTLRTSESTPSSIPLTHIRDHMETSRKPESAPTHLPIMIFCGARFAPFNRSYLRPGISWPVGCHASALVGAAVGLIHGIPLWNAQFVTTTGQWLWRASCIVQVVIPAATAMMAVIEIWYSGVFLLVATLLMAFIYCVSRIVLLTLVWISFWSLPTSVYLDIDWSWSYIPHWH